MGDPLRQRPGDQPLPTPNDRPDVQSLVIADMEQRRKLGIQRYGMALQPHNGRDALRDLYEELLDGAMYARQVMVERDEPAGQPEPGPVTHTIKVTIDRHGCNPLVRFECHQPEMAFCRQRCTVLDCEGGTAHRESQDQPHRMVDRGACMAVEWFTEEDEPLDGYDGPDDDLHSGPIEVRWEGEYWTWRYPAEREAAG